MNEEIMEVILNHTKSLSEWQRHQEFYIDFRYDVLCEGTVKKILKSEYPMDVFYDHIFEWDGDDELDYFKDDIHTIKQDLIEANLIEDEFDIDDWDIWEYMRDYCDCYVGYPIQEILDSIEIPVNFVVENSSEYIYRWDEYDNEYREFLGKEYLVKVDENLLILGKLFGVDEKDFKYHWLEMNEKVSDTSKMKALTEELENLFYSESQLTFTHSLDLGQLLELKEFQKENPEAKVKFTDCNGGFVTYYNGSGSILELGGYNLEFEFKISELDIDADYSWNYGIDSVYGMCQSFWNNSGCIEVEGCEIDGLKG